jgi:predicted ATPase
MDVDRTFVGRAAELGLLGARLDDARGGRGQLVLVTGEPGIGKTRLAGELARRAEAMGVQLGWGRASETRAARHTGSSGSSLARRAVPCPIC